MYVSLCVYMCVCLCIHIELTKLLSVLVVQKNTFQLFQLKHKGLI